MVLEFGVFWIEESYRHLIDAAGSMRDLELFAVVIFNANVVFVIFILCQFVCCIHSTAFSIYA